jgi:hypothetical protein
MEERGRDDVPRLVGFFCVYLSENGGRILNPAETVSLLTLIYSRMCVLSLDVVLVPLVTSRPPLRLGKDL